MRVRRENGRGEVTLPAAYVRHHVELGYAATAYRAQGRTVDTAHAMVGVTTTREVLYVAATRGREANTIYVDTIAEPDTDTSHGPDEERDSREILRAVIGNVGADVDAHATIECELNRAESVDAATAEYQTISNRARTDGDDDLGRALAERARFLRHVHGPLPRSDDLGVFGSMFVAESHEM
jgi:hypothetical protein